MTTGRLAVRVEPVAGEAIDSWLAATARAMDVTVGSIARAFGLPAVLHPLWITWLAQDQVNAMSAATGLAASTVEAMTLSAYDGVALKLDPNTHRLATDFPFNAVGFSRFCPDCLSESDGRWQLTWRLGWKFACTRHNSLSSDECPKCGKRQHKDQVFKEPPLPASCRCGFDLRTTSRKKLSIAHPILQAQQRVHEFVFGGYTSFGVFEEMRIALVDLLTTIRSLANRVLAFAAVEGLASVTAAEVPGWVHRVERTSRPLLVRNAVNNRAPWRAVDTAVGVTAALSILNTATIHDAGVRARPYLQGQNADTGAAELRSCPRDGVIPAAIVIKASIPWMGPEGSRPMTAIFAPRAAAWRATASPMPRAAPVMTILLPRRRRADSDSGVTKFSFCQGGSARRNDLRQWGTRPTRNRPLCRSVMPGQWSRLSEDKRVTSGEHLDGEVLA